MYNVLNLDSDGVIYDLTGQLARMDGYSYMRYWFDQAHIRGMSYNDYFTERMNAQIPNGLFYKGNALHDAEHLLEHLVLIKLKYNIKLNLLTAAPHDSPLFEEVKRQKLDWYKKVGYDVLFDELIVTNGSWGKLDYSHEKSILIDDHIGSQRRFNEKNYPFILHRSTKDSIQQLEKILPL